MCIRKLIGQLILLVSGACVAANAQDLGLIDVDGALNNDQRFEAFAVATDGNVYHRWESTAGGDWSWWAKNVNGRFKSARVIRTGGRLMMFGLDDGVLVVRAQATPGGAFLEQSFRTGNLLKELAVAHGADGRVQVAAIGGDGNLWVMSSNVLEPDLAAADWSAWESVTAYGLHDLALALDGDSRMTAAALTNTGALAIFQQTHSESPSAWRSWPESTAPQGLRGLKLVLGSNVALSLLGVDERGVVVGKSLPRVGTTPLRTGAEQAMAEVPLPPVNPRATIPRPTPPRGTIRPPPPPLPLGRWTGWSDVLRYQSGFVSDFAVARNLSGRAEIAAVANRNEVVHIVQSPNGTWAGTLNTLMGSDAEDEYLKVRLQITPAGMERIFVVERKSLREFIASREAGGTWKDQSWRALGKIPGYLPPDLTLAIKQCLDAGLRQSIMESVKSSLKRTVKGTPLEGLVGNANTAGQCTNQVEMLALWLNNEPHPGPFATVPVFPETAIFVYRIHAETLTSVIGNEIKKAVANLQEIDISNFAVQLNAPDKIAIPLDASWKSFDFSATATARFSIVGGKPKCNADLTASRPNGAYAIIGLVVPLPVLSLAVEGVDAIMADKVAQATAQIQALCRLTDAMLTELFLPRAKNGPLLKLTLPYETIRVSPSEGLVATGGLPGTEVPRPAIDVLWAWPMDRTDLVKTNAVKFMLQAHAVDLKPPIEWTWTPTQPSLKLPNALGYPASCCAFFTYGVEPVNVLTNYDLGQMNVRAKDEEGQCVEAAIPIRFGTRNPDDPSMRAANELPAAANIPSAPCPP